MINSLQLIWKKWLKFGRLLGDFIGRLVLTIFYFTIFLPFGIVYRFFQDPLDKRSHSTPMWLDRKTGDQSYTDVRRLF